MHVQSTLGVLCCLCLGTGAGKKICEFPGPEARRAHVTGAYVGFNVVIGSPSEPQVCWVFAFMDSGCQMPVWVHTGPYAQRSTNQPTQRLYPKP